MNKQIYVLVGISYSGKTSWIKHFEKYKLMDAKVLSRDDIRDKYKLHQYTTESESKVTEYFDKLLNEAILDDKIQNIVLNNTHCKTKYIEYIVNSLGHDNTIIIIFFDIPLYKAYYRNIIRWFKTDKWIPFKTINDMYKSYNKIDKEYYKELLQDDW